MGMQTHSVGRVAAAGVFLGDAQLALGATLSVSGGAAACSSL